MKKEKETFLQFQASNNQQLVLHCWLLFEFQRRNRLCWNKILLPVYKKKLFPKKYASTQSKERIVLNIVFLKNEGNKTHTPNAKTSAA